MPVRLLAYGPIQDYGCYTLSGQSITLRLPVCYGSHNLDMVGYLQVPSNLFRNPRNVIFPAVGVLGTHIWPYDVFLDERCSAK